MSNKLIIPTSSYPEIEQEVTAWVQENLGQDPEYDDDEKAKIDRWGYPWFRSGVLLLNHSADKVLLVHEARVQVKKIKDPVLKNYYLEFKHKKLTDWVDGDGGWNFPAGRVKPGESFEDCAKRETKEESGHESILKAHLCTRISNNQTNRYNMPVYLAESISGPDCYKSDEVLETAWFSLAEVVALRRIGALRSPEFVMDTIAAYKAGIYW